jgi:hypothetical protein
MERFIIKGLHISPPQNQEIGKSPIVLYAINIVSKYMQSDLVCSLITWLSGGNYLPTQYLVYILILMCIYIYTINFFAKL